MVKSNKNVRLANSPMDYANLNIMVNQPQPREDGMRTEGDKNSYEWWYNDAEYDNGTKVVTVFYSKNYFDVEGPSQPTVDIDITHPDGSKTHRFFQAPKGMLLNAKKEICDVKIERSYLRYENNKYVLHFEEGDVVYHAEMTSLLPMWRPKTGHWFYGDYSEHFFAWFVAQPSSQIEASLTIGNKTQSLHGTGYHDHNWGNIGMDKLMNHWYWGRAKIDGYDVIACDIIAEKKYNYTRLPVFMLAKNGVILSDDESLTQIKRSNTVTHPKTRKFMDNLLTYNQPISENEFYTIEFKRKKDIVVISLLQMVPPLKRMIARLMGLNPTYARISGEVTLTHVKDGVKKTHQQEGLWEQMFFGSNKDALIENENKQV